MKPFRYARDGLCLAACAAYGVNRWVLPARWKGPFLRDYFDDLLLIPAALPLLLGLQRLLGTRRADGSPSWMETGVALVIWSVAAEVLAPRITTRAVSDPRDVLVYAAGAVVAGLWWHRP